MEMITYKEFEKQINELGYTVDYLDNSRITLAVRHGGDVISLIDKKNVNQLLLSWNVKNNDDLFNLCVKLASTPIPEREEPVKYTLQCPLSDFYLGYSYFDKEDIRWAHPNQYKVYLNREQEKSKNLYHFTQEEIDLLPNQDFIKSLIKESV